MPRRLTRSTWRPKMRVSSSCILTMSNKVYRASGAKRTSRSMSLSGPKSSRKTEPNNASSVIRHRRQNSWSAASGSAILAFTMAPSINPSSMFASRLRPVFDVTGVTGGLLHRFLSVCSYRSIGRLDSVFVCRAISACVTGHGCTKMLERRAGRSPDETTGQNQQGEYKVGQEGAKSSARCRLPTSCFSKPCLAATRILPGDLPSSTGVHRS